MVYELGSHIHTDFALIVHADGFVVHPEMWQDAFLDYDYIGARGRCRPRKIQLLTEIKMEISAVLETVQEYEANV